MLYISNIKLGKHLPQKKIINNILFRNKRIWTVGSGFQFTDIAFIIKSYNFKHYIVALYEKDIKPFIHFLNKHTWMQHVTLILYANKWSNKKKQIVLYQMQTDCKQCRKCFFFKNIQTHQEKVQYIIDNILT